MTVKERKLAKQYLKNGDMEAIAKMAKVSRITLHKYINGAFESSSVGVYFEKMVAKRKAELDKAFE